MEYYLTIKKLLIYASLWMNLKNIIKVREVGGKNHNYILLFTQNVRKRQI